MAEAAKAKTPKVACRHLTLHFERGGLHLVCEACGQAYTATLSPHRIIQDLNAMRAGLYENDRRVDPLAPHEF